MYNEDQRNVKAIQHRTISLTSSVESLTRSLRLLSATSELSPDLQSLVAATSALASLTTAGLAVLQYEADRLFWTSGSARLQNLREHWLTAYENLSELVEQLPINNPPDDDCPCDD